MYAPPRAEQKMQFMESLGMLKRASEGQTWILGGDLNLVRNLKEKKGRLRKIIPISEYFIEVIDNLELVDFRTTNGTFTWNNKRTGDRVRTYRLYHFLVLESIMMNGGEIRTMVLPSSGSDHFPIKMEWDSAGVNLCRPFHFEIFWLLQDEFIEKLKECGRKCQPLEE